MKTKAVEKPKPTKVKTEPSKEQARHKENREITRELMGEVPDDHPIPHISTFNLTDEEVAEAEAAVAAYREAKRIESDAKAAISKLRDKIIVTAVGDGKDGFRCKAGTVVIREQAQTNLSEDELLKHITADILTSCKVKGKPYFVVTVK